MIKRQPIRGNGHVKVTFAVPADVGPVSVVGDFNGWDPLVHPLKKRRNGTRSVVVELPQDEEVRFRYLADGGVGMDDPEADEIRLDGGLAHGLLRL